MRRKKYYFNIQCPHYHQLHLTNTYTLSSPSLVPQHQYYMIITTTTTIQSNLVISQHHHYMYYHHHQKRFIVLLPCSDPKSLQIKLYR